MTTGATPMILPTDLERRRARLGRWLTRGLGVVVEAFFGLIAVLALTGEDPPRPEAWPMLACLGVCLIAVLLAWRWPEAGGAFLVLGALSLAVAVACSSLVFGLGPLGLALALIYPAPFLLVGALSLADARADREAAALERRS